MSKSPTVISASTTVKGRIQGQEDVEVLGRVEGQVEIEGQLSIDSNARVDAQIQATTVTVHGIIVGDTIASESIYLDASARVVGNLSAPSIVIEEGAKIRGLVETGDNAGDAKPKAKKPSAPSPRRTSKPAQRTEPAPDPVDDDADEDDEPDLPASASKKKVSVKKRG